MTLNLRKRALADGTKSPSYPGELPFVAFRGKDYTTLLIPIHFSPDFYVCFFRHKLVLIFHYQVARRCKDQTEDVVRIFQRCSQAFFNWDSSRNSRKRLFWGIIRDR
jgi:hypothetical protein